MRTDIAPCDRPAEPSVEAVKSLVREIHAAIEHRDAQGIGDLVVADAFILGAASDAISVGRAELVTRLRNRLEQAGELSLRVRAPQTNVGLCDSGTSAWFLDRCTVDVEKQGVIVRSIPFRLTGLVTLEARWQIVAAYWSVPLRSNEHLHSLLHGQKIRPGAVLAQGVEPAAGPLVQAVATAVVEPPLLPDLLSTRPDAFTVGAIAGEVFFGPEGRRWMSEIARLPAELRLRGGIRSGLSPDRRTGWLALHLDLDAGLTIPYRFLTFWLWERDEWQVVVLHNAVSVEPANAGFTIPSTH